MPATRSQKKQKIAAIITDLGGVLINVDKENMCAKFAKHSASPLKHIREQFSPVVMTGHEIELGTGRISPQQFYRLVSEELRLKGFSFDAFNKAFSSDIFTRKNNTLTLIRRLSRKYPVTLLSNTNELHYPYWAKTLGKDMKLFKTLVLSYEVGIAKPDSRIFLEAAKRLGVEPQQCVFIDDVEAYVEAARKVGMLGIRFVSAQQLQQDLSLIGVRM